MLKFHENNEFRTLNDRVQKPEAQWTRTRKYKDERKCSVLDYVVVEYGKYTYAQWTYELQIIT